MSLEQWAEFQYKVRQEVEKVAQLHAHTPYKGQWEGNREDAAIYFGTVVSEGDMGKLRVALSNLATYYGQQAIGLTVGESQLIESYEALQLEAA